MPGNNPNKPQPVHQTRQSLFNNSQPFRAGQILKLPFQSRQKLDIILGLPIQSLQLFHLILELVDNSLIILQIDSQQFLDLDNHGIGQLLMKCGNNGISGPPILDFGHRRIRLGFFSLLLLDGLRNLLTPRFHNSLQFFHEFLVFETSLFI